MDALRARLHRRAALRRALPAEEVNEKAVREFWGSLSLDDRLDVLRFEDATLVQRMHGHMTSLCKSELWCRRNVMAGLVRGGGSSDSVERLKGFAFEAPAESDCMGRRPAPDAFCAAPDLAGSETLFEDLKKALGSSLLQGRPVLLRQDWASVAETTPSSWSELQVQALRLVELAIFQAQRDAAAAAADVAAAAATAKADAELAAELEDGVAPAPATKGQRAKKKGKKNKSAASRAADTKDQDASRPAAARDPEQACEEDPVDAATEVDNTGGGGLEEDEEEEDGEVDALDTATVGEDEAKSAGETEAKDVTKALVPSGGDKRSAIPVSASRGWSAWLRSVVREDNAEWRWVIFDPSNNTGDCADGGSPHPGLGQPSPAGVRAVVKNTFLDLEHDNMQPQQPFRKSCYF